MVSTAIARRLVPRLLLLAIAAGFGPPPAEAAPQTAAAAPFPAGDVLARRCLSCHGQSKREGELSLATRSSILHGGESGPVVVPGEPDESLLWQYVDGDDPEMPKDADPLTPQERKTLRDWITQGAPWPAVADSDQARQAATDEPTAEFTLEPISVERRDWWSWQPLRRVTAPSVTGRDAPLAKSPIDAFLLRRLQQHGLAFSPVASRRTLIRRLYFDLVGLPPTPEQIAAFEEDRQPLAYERLVDQLLASPRYGERWARHWLDVVHYGDTHGYDKDKLRPNAWPYRDYVIDSLNSDKPYVRFVQEQVAGDALWPDDPQAIVATGFIAAGPWDFIGHAEVPETKIDGQVARNLDRDDMVCNTINTFLGVTVQCARCHNHKFDPITQQQYYSLQAVFAALDRADRPYDADPRTARRRQQLTDRLKAARSEYERLNAAVRSEGGERLVELQQRIAQLDSRKTSATAPQFGYHSGIETKPNVVKWVQVDLGTPHPIRRVQLLGAHDDFGGIGDGFGFPVRFRVQVGGDPQMQEAVTVVDRTQSDVPNPGIVPLRFDFPSQMGRYVRITATRLAPRANDFIFALAELQVFADNAANLAAGRPVTALDSIESPPRWSRDNLVDGIFPATEDAAQRAAELAEARRLLDQWIEQTVPAATLQARDAARTQVETLQAALDALPPPRLVYAGTVHYGQGAFRGTGPNGGKPREIRILHRGDVTSPGEPVGPGTLDLIPGVSWHFDVAPDQPESARRVALARWLVRNDNPLLWRSIANRVWLYHFGQGIVDTPNDLGRMGSQPTHPELLDWLAMELRDNGQSLKKLHRLIVTSYAYRQESLDRERGLQIDADNRLLWRMNRRFLDAESIRDTILSLAGKLDLTMGGPGFQDFIIEHPEHSPHYEYDKADVDDRRTHRRSVYRFLVRSQQQPFMQTLDCADPSQSVARRQTTLTALQALTLLNSRFVVRMSEHFAARLRSESSLLAEQVARGFALATGRTPTAAEREALQRYASAHGLANTCRLLLNLNETVVID